MGRTVRWLTLDMLLLGLLAAVAITWPLALHLAHRLPGSALVGAYSHAWKYWWTAHALLDLHQNPAYCDLVNHPAGLAVGYYLASFLEAVWVLPVTRLLGPAAGVSVFTIGTLATAFWATTLLARWCGLGRGPAVLAALAWAFAPHYLGFLMGGSPENLSTPWVPLCLLASLALVGLPGPDGPRDPRAEAIARWRTPARRALLAGGVAVTLLLQALTTWYGGLTLGIVAGGVLLVGAWARRRDGFGGVGALLLGLLTGTAGVALGAHFLLPAQEEPLGLALHIPVSTELSWLWATWKRDQPESVLYASSTLWLNHHLILTVVVLALLGGRRRGGRIWLLASLPFVVDLVVPQSLVGRLRIPTWGEGSTLHVIVTMLAMHAERRLGTLHLFLGLAAGHGLAWLADAARRRQGRTLAAAVVAVAFAAWGAESVWLGPVRLPVASFEPVSPPHCGWLAAQGGGAVIDLPLRVRRASRGAPPRDSDAIEAAIKALRSRYLFEQTLHGLPVLAAIGTRLPLRLEDLPIQDPLLSGLAIIGTPTEGLHLSVRRGWTPHRLASTGFRWVVLHRDLTEGTTGPEMEAELRRLLGDPVVFDDALVFRIPDTPTVSAGS